MKEKKKCPYCKYETELKRIAVGIWKCKKCKTLMTNKAWSLDEKCHTKTLKKEKHT